MAAERRHGSDVGPERRDGASDVESFAAGDLGKGAWPVDRAADQRIDGEGLVH